MVFQENKNKGFSLIELIIGIGITVLLMGLTISGFSSLETREDFVVGREKIANVLRDAREKAIASEGEQDFGVHFEADNITLFQGATFDSMATTNRVYNLPPRSVISSISLSSGSSDAVFERLTGQAKQFGNIVVNSRNNTWSGLVYINQSGSISFEPSLATGGRIIDSRHTHFNLGWSIQNSSTLTLRFTRAGIDKDINMAAFFNASKARFAWQEVLDIAGNNEELIVHTHFLDGTNTILSITRDREINDLLLEVLIDGFQIAVYNASGDVTVGSSGGTMMIQ